MLEGIVYYLTLVVFLMRNLSFFIVAGRHGDGSDGVEEDEVLLTVVNAGETYDCEVQIMTNL